MLISLLVAGALATSNPIYGIARAADGDSLEINGTRVRLFGIDAPEFDQICQRSGQNWACGQASANKLKELVDGRELRCDPISEDQYGRTLGRCYVRDQEINRTMVALGLATAYRRYSQDYVEAEQSARLAKRGLWSGTFQVPSEYRHPEPIRTQREPAPAPQRSQRAAASSRSLASSGCVIKGNQSRRGEWIYHLPGMPYYEQTRPEAMFCTEAQAQAAGYRRAKVR